jgi:hypothetical protein
MLIVLTYPEMIVVLEYVRIVEMAHRISDICVKGD